MSNDSAVETAVHYTASELELLDANCRTALPFDEKDQENQIIEDMGRRAKAKRQRAARVAAENQTVGLENDEQISRSEETDCEVPSAKSSTSPSKIPVLQKGYQASKSVEEKSDGSDSSPSKIPRPLAQLVYLKNRQELPTDSSAETTELPSFTASSDFTNSEMITASNNATVPRNIQPLPKCDLSSEMESLTKPEKFDREHVVVLSEANGTKVELDMTAMLAAVDIKFVGVKFQ